MDTTEKKTYIVDIQSNLDKYIKEADEARKKVDEMTVANLKVQASEKTTGEERERSNASLRDAKKEYANAKKSVDLATLANKAQSGSYEQLYRNWQLAQTQLKLMGNGLVQNADGTYKLTAAYIQQSKVVEQAKRGLDAFGKGIADNRLNVGNYSEAIKGAMGELQMMPGPLGAAASGVTRLGTAFKALLANPIVLVLSLVVGVIAAIGKAFKNSQPLMDAFHKVAAAVGATFKVILDRMSNFVEFLGSVFNNQLRESRREARLLNDELIGIEETMTRREKRELRRANKKGFFEEIKEEATAAYGLVDAEQKLEDAEIKWITRRAELKRQVEELINSAKDENLTNKEKLENLDEAIAKTKELTDKEVGFARERARISQERLDQGNSTREDIRKNEELQAAAAEAEAAGLKEQKRILSERFTLINKIKQEDQQIIKDKEDLLKQEISEQIAAEKHWAQLNKEVAKEGMLLKTKASNYKGFFDMFKSLQEKTVEVLKSTNEVAADSDTKLTNLKITNQEMIKDSVISSLDVFSTVLGRQTEAGKAFAIAAATIDTYAAAAKALNDPTIPSTVARFAMMAAVILRGLANVKQIMDVKVGSASTGTSISVPSSISSSPAAMRAYAPTVGGSLFSTTPMSQAQLNALPNQNLLTAQDIANALANLPPPVVTVEDINARVSAMKKVNVRATI